MPPRQLLSSPPKPPRPWRAAGAVLLLAVLAACQTTPPAPRPPTPAAPGNVTRLPPGNAERDGPEANPPPNLEAVPDPVPQIEPIRNGGPNKPYEISGQTYVPLTDDRALTEKGLASWYGRKFHGRRTASGEAYNMYAMTAAHKTLPIPSYARVRNPLNGKEVIVRVNDRGPFVAGRIVDLSYTAAVKLGMLNGVGPVEITRITADDIRTGAAQRRPAPGEAPGTLAAGELDRPGGVARAASPVRGKPAPVADSVVTPVPETANDVIAVAVDTSRPGAQTASPTLLRGPAVVDLGAAAAADVAPAGTGVVTTVSETVATRVTSPAAVLLPPADNRPDEHARAETVAGSGWWLQLGAFRQREGALAFHTKVTQEQPWLAPLLAVFMDRGLNKVQAGPYASRSEARSAAERVRGALQLVPTIIEKR